MTTDVSSIVPTRMIFSACTVSLSPDGHSIAFQKGKTVSEVWALENFLPAPGTKK